MIALRPMTPGEFDAYLDRAVPEYAQAHIDAGDVDRDRALEKARGDYATLLPAGLKSDDQHLFSIYADDAKAPIGMVWFELREDDGRKSAFIYDFRIDESQRGKGYGQETLARVDETVKSMGARSVALNVFGHNERARALYEKHGFRVTSVWMRKVFGARQEP